MKSLSCIRTVLEEMEKNQGKFSRVCVCVGGGPIIFTARKRSLGQGNIFIGVCQEFCSQGGGVYPSMPCRSHDQPAVYKQLHCWWVSVGVEAAYR